MMVLQITGMTLIKRRDGMITLILTKRIIAQKEVGAILRMMITQIRDGAVLIRTMIGVILILKIREDHIAIKERNSVRIHP